MDEWVETEGATVDSAVQLALKELGLSSPDEVNIEVIREPKPGILGSRWREVWAVVKVSPKPKRRRRRRRRGKGEGSKASGKGNKPGESRGGGRDGGNQKGGRPREKKKKSAAHGVQTMATETTKKKDQPERERPEPAPIEEQAGVAKDFLAGVLDAFGLEGNVDTRIEEDILYVDVTGDQTEALIGPKGSVMQALHELTRTVIQRKTYGAPRMRIDVAGYTERRREALRIYTAKLADRVVAEGGEVMLEPMNAADRKVVHDTVAEIAGIRSFSEGEEPRRAVVIAADADTAAGAETEDDAETEPAAANEDGE